MPPLVFAGPFDDIGEFNVESTVFIVVLAALVLAFLGLAIFGHQTLRWRLLFAGLAATMADALPWPATRVGLTAMTPAAQARCRR